MKDPVCVCGKRKSKHPDKCYEEQKLGFRPWKGPRYVAKRSRENWVKKGYGSRRPAN